MSVSYTHLDVYKRQGLSIYRIGLSHVTVTGAHPSISGSVNADIASVSEAVQSSPKKQEIQRQQR